MAAMIDHPATIRILLSKPAAQLLREFAIKLCFFAEQGLEFQSQQTKSQEFGLLAVRMFSQLSSRGSTTTQTSSALGEELLELGLLWSWLKLFSRQNLKGGGIQGVLKK